MGMEKECKMKKGCRSNWEWRRGRTAWDKRKETCGKMESASLGELAGRAGNAGLGELAGRAENAGLGKLAGRAGNIGLGERASRTGNAGLVETDGKGGCILRLAGLALALGMAFLQREPMALKAADYEARINGTYYERLEEAFNNAKQGDTVFVLKDCSVSETLAVNAEGIVLKSEDVGNPAVVSRDEDFRGEDNHQEGTKSILVRVDGGSLVTQDIILDGGAVLDGDFRNSGQEWESPLVYVKGTYRMESGTVLQNNYNTDGNEDNSTARFAGAVQVMEGGKFDMRGGIIRNCYTNGSGGGVHARNGSSVSMESGNIWNCYGMTGGAMAFFGPAEVSGMTLSGNCAKTGGAVEIHHEVRLSGCVLENNRALLRGGAVGISGDCPVTVEGCLLIGNSAAEGSAASISDAGGNCRPVFRDCTITGNRVSGNYCGAIHYMGRAGEKEEPAGGTESNGGGNGNGEAGNGENGGTDNGGNEEGTDNGGGVDEEGNGNIDGGGDGEGNGNMNGSGAGEGNVDGSEGSEGDEGENGNGDSGGDEIIDGGTGSEGNRHDDSSEGNGRDTGEDMEGGIGKDGKKEPVIQTGRFSSRKFFFLTGLAGVVLVLSSRAEKKRGKKLQPWALAGIIMVFVLLSGIGISLYWEEREMEKYKKISEDYKRCESYEVLQGKSEARENGVLEAQGEATGKGKGNGVLGMKGEAAGKDRENGTLETQEEATEKRPGIGALGMKWIIAGKGWENRILEIKRKSIGREQETEGITGYGWEDLCRMNPDTAGWLYLPDSLIDFPVAAAKDNEFYLSHDFTGAVSRIGCLFMDKGTDSGDFNRVIYGHNMGAGSEAMFSTLLKYEEEKYFDNNRFLYFADVYGDSARYEVMAVVKYNVKDVMEWDFRERNFGSVEDYEVWMGQMQERALYFRQPERGTGRMITLSTCDRREYGKDGRFLVFASGI